MGGLAEDTEEGRNAYASRQEHCRFGGVLVQSERPARAIELYLSSQGHLAQHPFECSVTHSRANHQIRLKGSAGDGERADVAFSVGFRRIVQRHIDRLSRAKLESGRLIEVEGHRPL